MNKPRRPEKKEHICLLSTQPLFFVEGFKENRTIKDWIKFGYNQSCDEWEEYIEAFLPSEDDLYNIMEDIAIKFRKQDEFIQTFYVVVHAFSKAISKRLRGEG